MNKADNVQSEQEIHMSTPKENIQRKAMNYTKLDWQLKGNLLEPDGKYGREFG
jgi:hypothetical protein